MPEFVVKLSDERGHVTEQVESAHTEAEVRERLSQRGLYIQSVRSRGLLAGEKSGNLEEVLARYISYQRMALSVRKKLISSLIYPALLVVAVTVMVTYLITFVVPKFGELYEQLDTQLPAITVFMLNVGHMAQNYFWIFGLAIILLVLFVLRWRKTPS